MIEEKWIWRYYELGLNILPIKNQSKEPNIQKWKNWQRKRQTKDEIQKMIDEKLFENIAIIGGRVSGNIVCFDFDQPAAFIQLELTPEALIQKGAWVTKTPKQEGRYHVVTRDIIDLKITKKTLQGIEMRANNHYWLAYPSIHPNGKQYDLLNTHNPEELQLPKEQDAFSIWQSWMQILRNADNEQKMPAMTNEPADAEEYPVCVKNALRTTTSTPNRYNTAFAIASHYKQRKIPKELAKARIKRWNMEKCSPPKVNSEIEKAIDGAYNTEKTIGCSFWKENTQYCPYNEKTSCKYFTDNYQPKASPAEEKPAEQLPELTAEELEAFTSNPLAQILSIITQKHTGTEKELKTALSGFLYILRVIAKKDHSGILKIIGSSSAGKTNLANTLLKCFPDSWIKTLGSISANALKYIKWKDEKILYIQEAGGAEETTEHLKLMDAGDGGFKAAVTVRDENGEFTTKEYEIPVKFIITTRAEGVFDQQLENRMFSLSIDESPEQTFVVLLHRCMEFAGYLKEQDFRNIQKFLTSLQQFDEIIIPYTFEFLNILEQKQIRVRRDIDKILSLNQTSAFLNQKNRPSYTTEEGKRILFATPEDAYNVFTITFPSFQETITGLSKNLQVVYDALPADGASLSYRDIAKKIGWYKMKVIRACEELDNKGYAEIDTEKKTHTVKKADLAEQITKDFDKYKLNFLAYTAAEICKRTGEASIPIAWNDINDSINHNINRNKLSQEIEPLLENRNINYNKTVTKKREFYSKDELTGFFGNNEKTVIDHFVTGFVTLFVTIFSPEGYTLFKYCNIVTNRKKEQPQPNVKLDFPIPSCYDVTTKLLKEKLQEAVQIIEDNPEDNYKLIEDRFGQPFIDRALEKGIFFEKYCGRQLIFIGGKNG